MYVAHHGAILSVPFSAQTQVPPAWCLVCFAVCLPWATGTPASQLKYGKSLWSHWRNYLVAHHQHNIAICNGPEPLFPPLLPLQDCLPCSWLLLLIYTRESQQIQTCIFPIPSVYWHVGTTWVYLAMQTPHSCTSKAVWLLQHKLGLRI